jgi:CBS domain-containing protein
MKVNGRVSAILPTKSSRIWSLSPDEPVYAAIELMAEKGIGALVVIENDELVGIISERDYARKVILMGRSSKETPVREIMTAPPTVIGPDCAVDEAMRIMTTERIRHLPVVEKGKLRGLVSIGDLVNWIITSHEQTIEHLQSYIAGA